MYDTLLSIAKIAPITMPLAAIVAWIGIKTQLAQKRLERSLSISDDLYRDSDFRKYASVVNAVLSNRLEFPVEDYVDRKYSG